jgi:hypothetical protein
VASQAGWNRSAAARALVRQPRSGSTSGRHDGGGRQEQPDAQGDRCATAGAPSLIGGWCPIFSAETTCTSLRRAAME